MFQAGMGGDRRVPDILDQVRQEYDKMVNETTSFKAQRDEYERKLESQVSELSLLQSSLAELERTHLIIKQAHEEEIMRLRRQLEVSGVKSKPIDLLPAIAASCQVLPGLATLTGGMGDLSSHLAAAMGDAAGTRPDSLFPSLHGVGLPFSAGGRLAPAGVHGAQIESVRPVDSSTGRPLDDWNVVHNPSATANTILELQHTLEHDSVVCCVRFSNNGKYIATGCNKTAVLYDAETGSRLAIFSSNGVVESQATLDLLSGSGDSYVRSVCFSPDSKILVAGAEDKKIKIWDIETMRLRHSLQGHTKDIYSVDVSSDGRYVISGSGDKRAKLWDVASGACVRTFGDDDGPKDGVTSVAVSPDCRFIAAGSLDRVVRLWDTESGALLERFDGHNDSVYSVSFSPDGKLLASGSLDKTLKLWDLTMAGNRAVRPKCKHTFEGHKDFVLSVVFAPQGTWLISGSKDRSVQFWDPKKLETGPDAGPVLILQGHQNSVISVSHSPAGKLFATGSGDKRARIWKYANVDK